MIAWLALFAFAAPQEAEATGQLVRCIQTGDKSCLAAALKETRNYHSPEYLAAAAEAYLLLGRNADAIAAIESAVKSKPDDYGLLLQRGRTYRSCQDQVQAIQSFLMAAKARPTSEVFYDIGLSFFLEREYDRARRHFVHATQLDARNHKAEFMLAALDVVKDNNEAGAKAHLERALEIEPANAHYMLHYGIVLMEGNDLKGSAAMLEKAAKADPSNPLVHFNLGRNYRQSGEIARARTELETAVRLRPAMARAYYQLAAVYRELGEAARAKQASQQFLKYKDQDRDDDPLGGPPLNPFRGQEARK